MFGVGMVEVPSSTDFFRFKDPWSYLLKKLKLRITTSV
jgi:hypothetical protein